MQLGWLCCGNVSNSAACLIQIGDFCCYALIPFAFLAYSVVAASGPEGKKWEVKREVILVAGCS